MATLANLIDRTALLPVRVTPRRGRQESRCVYAIPSAYTWLMAEIVHSRVPGSGGRQSPREQVQFMLQSFIQGDDFSHYRLAHRMEPHDDSVWELKTADVRFFGWFYRMDVFVLAAGDFMAACKRHGLYEGYRRQVVRERAALDLDPPDHVAGDYRDVMGAF